MILLVASRYPTAKIRLETCCKLLPRSGILNLAVCARLPPKSVPVACRRDRFKTEQCCTISQSCPEAPSPSCSESLGNIYTVYESMTHDQIVMFAYFCGIQ